MHLVDLQITFLSNIINSHMKYGKHSESVHLFLLPSLDLFLNQVKAFLLNPSSYLLVHIIYQE